MDSFYEFERDRILIGAQSGVINHQQGVNGKVAGNLAALAQIHDAVIILHGPKGCAYHYRYFARRRYLPYYNLESTDLTEAEVVGGGEDKLMALARRIIREQKPGCVVLLPTVASDVMQCDLLGIAAQLRQETGCPVIAVQSEVFSHIDKTVMRRGRKDSLKAWGKQNAPVTSDNRGCGFSEAMLTLAEQLMEPQTVIPGTVNVEGYAWGYGGRAALEGMDSVLHELNMRILNCLPNCTTNDIIHAPAAQVNIARRVRWAMALKERCGTEYMHIHGFARYTGLDGMELFYQELCEKAGMDVDARQILAPRMNEARQRLAQCSKAYDGTRVLLMPRFFTSIPNMLLDAVQGTGIPVHTVVAFAGKDQLRLSDMDDEMVESILTNIRRAMERAGVKTALVVNPDEAQLREILSETDLVIGDEYTQTLAGNCPVLSSGLFITALDPENLCRNAESLAANLGRYPAGSQLLLSRVRYEPGLYPQPAGEPAASARELYQKLWQNRGR